MNTIEDYKALTPAGTSTGAAGDDPAAIERADLLDLLTKHRFFLRVTADGLTNEQASTRTTVSALTVGGLVKHVAFCERGWVDFILNGPAAMAMTEDSYAEHGDSFRLLPGETLEGVLATYAEVAARTDALLAEVDLNSSHPLPEAPWFPPNARWTARRALTHIVAETAQHAGHADIIRESLDGSRTMG
ncbi:DinB family protein [Sporichthya sp.]|uniref:DinB family protein n=1 Tax=Sporichthya sp. TaxID=65475 RepID=UPI00180BBD7A|nr:DinB family protein [Sporichthya sp.]MBA3744969.1 DinB family protein [Sporichthya sp.]